MGKTLPLWIGALAIVAHLAWMVRPKHAAEPKRLEWQWDEREEVELLGDLGPAAAGFDIQKCKIKCHFWECDWHCYPGGGHIIVK